VQPDDLVEPVGYSVGWAVAGVVAVVLVLAWLVLAWLWTRRRDDEPAPVPAADPLAGGTPMDPFAGARRTRLAELDRVEREHRAGLLDDRAADLAVAAVLRDFAQVRTGRPARSLTAAELRALGWTGGTSEVIGDLLAPTFSAGGATPDSVQAALGRARTVVSGW
jgi:hypothetical protein